MNSPNGHATRCLETDHRALDAITLEVEHDAREGRFAQARERFARFASGLLRHIDAEEKVLFPRLLEMEEGAIGPISVMKVEHQEFRELLELVAAQLAASADAWKDSLWQLKQGLLAHNMKEERVLYPMADEAARLDGHGAELAEALEGALQPGQG
jgi:iron-sulfur cluster repair protein YtfE (RIC family)